MSSENEKSAIETLRERQLTDASALEIEEPDLTSFDLQTVLEADDTTPKRRLFKKRKERVAAEIKIKDEVKPAKEPVAQVVNNRIEDSSTEMAFTEEDKVITPDDVAPALLEVQPDILDELQPAENEAVDMEIELDKVEEEIKFVEDEPDIFYERKKFLASQYKKAEEYLEAHSKNGYHFAKKKGNRFYFKEGEPKNYYYQYCYYKLDPEKGDWANWEKEGWKLVGRATGRSNMDAGWFIFRNELQIGEYKKEIENDLEKLKLFRRMNSSYRSTVFLFFIIMCVCGVTAYLQYKFHGFLATLIACCVIFVLSFIFFIVYARYLWYSKKAFSSVKTTLRLKEKDAFIRSQNVPDYSKSEDELNNDWSDLEEREKNEEEDE